MCTTVSEAFLARACGPLLCLSLAVSRERPRRWCGPPLEGAPTEAVGADGLGIVQAPLLTTGRACEGELRETHAASRSRNHLSEVRPGVPQETAPQELLAAPASLGFLARLLAAVLKGGPRGEERGAGEEEEGRAGE